MSNPLNHYRRLTKVQMAAVGIIAMMAFMDFLTMRSLFIQMVQPSEAAVYSVILAAALEGLPFYLGMVHSEKVDEGRYNKNDRKVTKVGFKLAMSAMILVFLLSAAVRMGWFFGQWFTDQIRTDELWEELIPNAFLSVSPIVTSLLSYVASWFAFRSSYLEQVYADVIRKQDIFNKCKENFRHSYEAYQRARVTLWASLVEDSREVMPKTSSLYRKACFAKMRAKLVSNCVACYPTQIERFTEEVNRELEKYILEMAARSTLPQSISKLDLADLIVEHDELAMDYSDCWDYNFAGPDLMAELRSTLDNALVVAQFETVIRQNKKK